MKLKHPKEPLLKYKCPYEDGQKKCGSIFGQVKNFKQHYIIKHNKTSTEASFVAGKAGINLERVKCDDLQGVTKKEETSILSDGEEMQSKSKNKVLVIENIVIQEPNAIKSN